MVLLGRHAAYNINKLEMVLKHCVEMFIKVQAVNIKIVVESLRNS